MDMGALQLRYITMITFDFGRETPGRVPGHLSFSAPTITRCTSKDSIHDFTIFSRRCRVRLSSSIALNILMRQISQY